LKDLQDIVHELKGRGVALRATEQPIDTGTAAGKAFLDMLGVFAEFESNLRRERQLESDSFDYAREHAILAENRQCDPDLGRWRRCATFTAAVIQRLNGRNYKSPLPRLADNAARQQHARRLHPTHVGRQRSRQAIPEPDIECRTVPTAVRPWWSLSRYSPLFQSGPFHPQGFRAAMSATFAPIYAHARGSARHSIRQVSRPTPYPI
jgi:Resolvase, N terminal domain